MFDFIKIFINYFSGKPRPLINSTFRCEDENLMVLKYPLPLNKSALLRVEPDEMALLVEDGKIIKIVEPPVVSVRMSDLFSPLEKKTVRLEACSLYFVRTKHTNEIRWGVSGLGILDPYYCNSLAYVGAVGTYNISVIKERVELFFNHFVQEGTDFVSYETVEEKLSHLFKLHFEYDFVNAVKECGRVEGLNLYEIGSRIGHVAGDVLFNEFGLLLEEFVINNILITDSPEREMCKKMKLKIIDIIDKYNV